MNPKYSLLCKRAFLLACVVPTVVAAAPQRQTLRGHVPAAIAKQNLLPAARLPGTNRLTLAIGLPFRNRELLTNLLNQIYDPASTNYQRYLTPEQSTETFGPSEQDYQALLSFAKAQGLTVTGTHSNRTLVDVQAPAAEIERVFHVSLRVYPHPTEDRTFFAPDTEPSLDFAVPLLHISGLDDYVVPRPNLKVTPLGYGAGATPNSGSDTNGSYLGSDFRHAYAPGVSLTGTGQVVGLLELDGYDPSDIARYESQAGLSHVPLQDVRLDGFSGSAGTNNIEVCLDIEMVISMAPGLSKVVVYEATNGPTTYLLDILNEMIFPTLGEPRPNQLSCSWTLPDDPNLDQAYQQLIIQGQSFFQSSGDWGAYYPGILQKSDSPFVTLVGGTTLTTGSSATWQSETTWNGGYDAKAGNYWASGGGISQTYTNPPWQQGVANQLNLASSSMRNSPDVSMVADGIWITFHTTNGTSQGITGGTSAAAPLWAGFMALVNQQAVANAEPTAGFINPAIYAIGRGPNYSSAFHDIGDYSNNRNDQAAFRAAPGYDLCTGWGTPNGQNLINLLAPPPPHIDSVSPTSFLTSASPQWLYIYGSGFTTNSTLLFNGSTVSDSTRLQVKSANEIDYKVIVQSAGTWSVQVVNGIQRSNSKNFTVSNAPPTTGSLVVNLSPDGIGGQWQVDGTGYNNSGQVIGYLPPGAHTVSFKPVAGYTTPANLSVNILAGQQTTTNATYMPTAPTTYTLTLNQGGSLGYIVNSPSGTWNGSAYVYNSGSVVQLTAFANTGYHFTGWSGDVSGTANPTTITMNGNKSVTANFASGDPNLATVTVTIKPDAAANAGVTWSVTGDGQLRASGTTLSEAVGSGYTTYLPITLNLVAGWLGTNGATSFLVPLTAGIVTNVTLTCVPDTTPGLLTVTLSPPDAANAGAHWHANGGTYGQGASVSLPPGNYTATFDPVSGWTAPASQPVTMQPAQSVALAANYSPTAGQPSIVSVRPSVGPLSGGTVMTIQGFNFTAPAAVLIGGQPASNVNVVDSSRIICITPSNSVFGSASVVVQTSGGSSTNLNGFAYGSPRGSGIELAGSIGGWVNAVAVNGSHCYFGEGSTFVVLDVSSPSVPTVVGRVALPGIIQDIALFSASGRQYVAVADDDAGLEIVDLTTPTAPVLRGYFDTGDTALGVAISGGNAFVGNGNSGLAVLDISDPTRVRRVGGIATSGLANKMVVQVSASGVLAYLVNSGSLLIVDVTDAHNPTLRGRTTQVLSQWYNPNSITISGNRAFLADGYGYLQAVDISNPDKPTTVGSVTTDNPSAVAIVGTRVYTLSSLDFTVFDLVGGTLQVSGFVSSGQKYFGNTMAVLGNYAYCAGGENGLYIYSVAAPANPTLAATVGTTAGYYLSVAVSGNTAYLATQNSGAKVFDTSDPANPALLSQFIASSGGGAKIAFQANRAYFLGYDGQIRILDVTNPRQTPTLLGTTSQGRFFAFDFYPLGNSIVAAGFDTTFTPYKPAVSVFDASNPGSVVVRTPLYFSTQNGGVGPVTGNGAIACAAVPLSTGNDSSLAVVNVSNPSSLQQVGQWADLGVVRTMRMSPDNRYLHVGCHQTDLSWKIFDLANVNFPALVSSNYLGDAVFGFDFSGTVAYLAVGKSILVYDITNPSQPRLLRSYTTPRVAFDVKVSGDTLCVADERAGLVVLELTDMDSPEVFITTPTFAPVYTNTTDTLTLGGASDDNLGLVHSGVTRITWSNSRGGGGDASGTTSWLANGISLQPGTNLLTVTAFDAAGNSGSDTLTVIYQAPKQDQNITFPPIASHTFGDSPVPLTAAASSGLLVRFSVVSGPASLTNNVLTLLGAGTVTVQASQAGNDLFNPAPATNVSFTVAKADQAVAFAPLLDKSAGDPPFALSATASSGLPVYFSIVSGPAVVDTNNLVTLLGGGVVTVSAGQPGNSNYNAAATVQRSFSVSKVPQTITFGPLSRQTVGDAPFPLSASASSGLQVSFALVSGPAVLSGNIVTVTGTGLVTVRASQDGNAMYAAASADQSCYVVAGNNLITDAQRLADGQFSLIYAGEAGRLYVVEYSTDLLSWTPLATNTVDSLGVLEFTDEAATSRDQSFYRVRSQ